MTNQNQHPSTAEPKWSLVGPGIVVVATLIVGAELLYSAGIVIGAGDQGMVDLAGVLGERYGTWMSKLFLGQPVYLILAYGVLGALFMPFMSVTLLWILNTGRVPREWRNKPLTNILLLLCTLAFAALALDQLRAAMMKVF